MSPASSSFLHLPAELRVIIYHLALPEEEVSITIPGILLRDSQELRNRKHNLLHTCKLISVEYLAEVQKHTPLHLTIDGDAKVWRPVEDSLGPKIPRLRRLLRSIVKFDNHNIRVQSAQLKPSVIASDCLESIAKGLARHGMIASLKVAWYLRTKGRRARRVCSLCMILSISCSTFLGICAALVMLSLLLTGWIRGRLWRRPVI